MQPTLIIVLATAAGVPLGLWLRRNLATLGYRKEDEQYLPDPGSRWWVVWASILALGSLAGAAALSRDPLAYLPLVPITASGPWLAAVDFDVLRIPNRVLAPTALVTLLTIVSIAASARDWLTLVVPASAALLAGGTFAAIHFGTKGGIGFGDVKLAALIGLASGSLGAGAVWFGMLSGSISAIASAKATGSTRMIPYGPWLLWGCVISAFAGLFLQAPVGSPG